MRFVKKDSKKKEPVIELWLVERKNKITLKGRDYKGSKSLMSFKDGKFLRCMNAELKGLETDLKGRIEER